MFARAARFTRLALIRSRVTLKGMLCPSPSDSILQHLFRQLGDFRQILIKSDLDLLEQATLLIPLPLFHLQLRIEEAAQLTSRSCR